MRLVRMRGVLGSGIELSDPMSNGLCIVRPEQSYYTRPVLSALNNKNRCVTHWKRTDGALEQRRSA